MLIDRHASFSKFAIWLLAALLLYYTTIIQIYPSVMIKETMKTFHLQIEDVTFYNTLFYYTRGLMIFPAALLIDRYGAGKTISITAFLLGLSSIGFGLSKTTTLLVGARILGGACSAFSFIAIAYISTHWFSKKWIGVLIGLSGAIMFAGSLTGQSPIVFLDQKFGWTAVTVLIGIIGIVLSLLIYLTVYFRPKTLHLSAHATTVQETFRGLKEVISHPQSWLNALCTLFYLATTAGFGFFWGVEFLKQTHNLSATTASLTTSMIFLGWIIGSPLAGRLSDLVRKRRPLIIGGICLTLLSLLPVIYLNHLDEKIVLLLLFCVGFFSSPQYLNVSLNMLLHHDRAAGSASGFISFFGTLSAALFQMIAAFFLSQLWIGKTADGVQIFTTGHWKLAMSIFPLALLIALCISFFLKEYYHEEY
ncbi:MAG: hypothetical protein S4CHLAM45_04090 [Chlamydiales bacterium]|nr:hypothetical protein [Chlamydiales bacterium]MCH9619263.1 hypothetical protein [Chlamydiales bacterium]MCH9622525.1 hypothetical protein [Chlamydiales bacterium]